MAFRYETIPLDSRVYFGEFLRLDGVPGGTNNASVDGSVAPKQFMIQPSMFGLRFIIVTRLIVTIGDNRGLAAEDYGSINGPIPDAARVVYSKDGVVYPVDGGDPIESNVGWASRSFEAQLHTYGRGSNYLHIRWDFNQGVPLVLRDDDYLQITIGADLTNLEEHTFLAQGWRLSSTYAA